MKISLLALISTAAAVPQYGHGHSKFHKNKPTDAYGTGGVKPYPTGGWTGGYNSTGVPHPTGTGSYGKDTTIDVTATSTTTLLKTVTVKPSPVSESKIVAQAVTSGAGGQCGPATITVTASEKVTITVTPGGSVGVPASSAVPYAESSVAPVESKSNGYGASSLAIVSSTPEAVKATPTPIAVYSSQPEAVSTPKAEATSSKAEVYPASSVAPKPVASSAVVSSAAPSSTPNSGNSYTGTKRGLAYNQADLCKNFGGQFGFGYNWAQVENNDIGTKYIPLMHGPDKSSAADWLANVDKACKKGSNAVMGFNEPDHPEQANLTPEAACTAWKEYMNPIASSHPEVTIIGPSVTNGPAPMGADWLQRFKTACPDAIYHATNMHFYDIYDKDTINRFKAQVEKIAAINNQPVWITEFGLNPGSATQEQAASFLKDVMDYCDNNPVVQGYSYFMVGSGENQLNSGSGLSTVGKVYAGAA
jgi:hypothetical protein